MADILLGLGAAVIKTAAKLWLKDHQFAAEMSGSIVDAITGKAAGIRERRRTQRLFEDLEETVADRLLTVLEHEFGGLADHERNAAVFAVTAAFERAELTDQDLFAADLDALFLERHIRAGSPDATRDLGHQAAGLYDRVLAECCAYVLEVTVGLPAFGKGALTEILRRETQIVTGIRELLDRIPRMDEADPDVAFLATYRRQVANTLDRLELFGVTVSQAVRRYPLSVAYISLNVQGEGLRQGVSSSLGGLGRIEEAHPRPDAAATTWRVHEALGGTPRLFVRGDAGSGKTTLLQWLAVRSARGDFGEQLSGLTGLVPFFLPLRRYVGAELPAPEHFLSQVGRHIADDMPRGWVHRVLKSGRALVLIDGIDELPECEREAARGWLRELVGVFPQARYVVTSRPAAATGDWLDNEGFDSAELLPMSWPDVKSFARHWHAAMRNETADEEEQNRLRACEGELLEKVHARRHLRELATNPLLCALLCALHLDRRMQLPQDRMELYAVALELLLERRETERRINDRGPALSRTDKSLILQNLAYWLIRNGLSDAPCDRVVKQVEQSLALMPRISADAEQVFSHLLNRSGLIREPVTGRVDFVHGTFQEYLAARAAIEAEDIGVLVEHAQDDQWREVIVMAAGHAQPRQRTELLRGLLDRAERDMSVRRVVLALAVACQETCPQIDPGLQEEIQQVTRDLLPPRGMADAKALAAAGEFVLDLLADRPPRGVRQAAATIRAAAGIGGDHALKVIARSARYDDPRIHEELMRAWPRFDPVEFARTVLRPSPHAVRIREINDVALMAGLAELKDLEDLAYRLPLGYGDLGFVERMPRLSALWVLEDPALRDLSPLSCGTALEHLLLGDVGDIALAPLADVAGLRSLYIDDTRGMDLTPLRSCARVKRLLLGQLDDIEVLGRSLAPTALSFLIIGQCATLRDVRALRRFEQLGRLRALHLNSCPLTDLIGIEWWAETLSNLSLRGASGLTDLRPLRGLARLNSLDISETGVGELAALRELPELTSLHLREFRQPPDLRPLAELSQLRFLCLAGSGEVDLTPLAGKPDLEVHLARRQRVRGAELLGPGSKIVRDW
ncbi:NACHT domain-containing protein [Actinomadura sp. HBU206391]|uniref:NACHT domain-containing protein n=1 Tax=Actinomadura sp. HBU206391 TaxID=2731692 RepID=UPI0016503EE1|nr:NACHT domain-containing protein [Actinomadura sp. HBU206391]MBC6459833.1 NACHT domain-containing protein [Actinomadura sp. HBU206391]